MPDPTSRKRLKQKMLERWENEGGRIASETTSTDKNGPIKEHGKKLASRSDKETRVVKTKRKPTRK